MPVLEAAGAQPLKITTISKCNQVKLVCETLCKLTKLPCVEACQVEARSHHVSTKRSRPWSDNWYSQFVMAVKYIDLVSMQHLKVKIRKPHVGNCSV